MVLEKYRIGIPNPDLGLREGFPEEVISKLRSQSMLADEQGEDGKSVPGSGNSIGKPEDDTERAEHGTFQGNGWLVRQD